jgi:hypothetical protein
VNKGAEIIIIPTWCNIERNLSTITAENGIPVAYAILRINCGAGEENLPSSVYDHNGDLISFDHIVGQNKIAISTVTLGNYKNMALGKTVSASDADMENPAANVVDGKYSTERDAPAEQQTSWKASSLPQWIEIDLGAEFYIDRVSIAQFNTDGYDYLIEGKTTEGEYLVLSDSVNKYETFLEHGIAGSEITSARLGALTPQKIRFVRLTINSSVETNLIINEIKIFGYVEPGLTSIDNTQKMHTPTDHKMLQIYPNPFNPETKIHYILKESSDVKLSVYNINGQIIKELVNKSMPAGEHTVKWNGKNLYSQEVSTGVYIAKIEMGTPSGSLITDSTKLILVR